MATKLSSKHLAIDNANSAMFIAVGVTTFMLIMCGYAGSQLLGQIGRQSVVIKEKEKTRDQMKKNVEAVNKLKVSYQEFSGKQPNILGGNPAGNGDRDGESARIVLDALPSKYDFPALATSLEKVFKGNGISLKTVTGTDDEVTQTQAGPLSEKAKPVEMPYSISASTSSGNVQQMMLILEKSIRPMQVNKISIKGATTGTEVSIDAKTYFQPGTKFNVTTASTAKTGKAASGAKSTTATKAATK